MEEAAAHVPIEPIIFARENLERSIALEEILEHCTATRSRITNALVKRFDTLYDEACDSHDGKAMLPGRCNRHKVTLLEALSDEPPKFLPVIRFLQPTVVR